LPATTTPGYLGVDVESVTPQLRTEYGFTPSSGAVVLSTVPGSPADQAGLQQEDVIVRIDSKTIASAADLQAAIQADTAGQRVKVTYYRGDKQHIASMTLISGSALQQLEVEGQTGFGGGAFGGGTTPSG
jgi:serine protease Do